MSVSTVPLPTSFFHPILRLLAEHPSGVRRRDLHEPIADLMGLTPEQRGELLPSGANLRYRHRLGWGLNILKNAGNIESPLMESGVLRQRACNCWMHPRSAWTN